MELPLEPIPAQLAFKSGHAWYGMFNQNCSFWKMQCFLCARFLSSGKSIGHYPSATRALLLLNCPQPAWQESLSLSSMTGGVAAVSAVDRAMPTPQRQAEARHVWDAMLSALELFIQSGTSAPCQCPVQQSGSWCTFYVCTVGDSPTQDTL